MHVDDLSEQQLQNFTIIERLVSVLSLLGCMIIIASFCRSKAFHKPINRLVFYASIGNMMTNVATLMARSYVGDGGSVGCQLQAFLIQMFMPADAFWTLAMAVNVYLTFYYKFDGQRLRRMEIPYLLCCYGIPFVVALTYIFVSTAEKGRMYGNATIWCWVSAPWDVLRIATFYGPVWVVIAITCFIYIRAGREIYRKHKQLRDLNYTSHYEPEPLPMNNSPFNTKTTEVTVSVSEAQEGIDLSSLGIGPSNKHHSISAHPTQPMAYSVSISAQLATPSGTSSTTTTTATTSTANLNVNVNRHVSMAPKSRRKAAIDANNAAWGYTKVAMLFFTAMLVTWIPSSANRLYSLGGDGDINLPLEYMSAFVLPLQGFWNAIIYCTTSWKACKMLCEDVGAWFKSTPAPALPPGRGRMGKEVDVSGVAGRRFVRMSKADSETESMEELAGSNRSSPV